MGLETRFTCQASAAFGLEGLVADELRLLKMANVHAENGDVRFDACPEDIFRCNLCLRFCDRVFIVLADQKCFTFDDLFDIDIDSIDDAAINDAINLVNNKYIEKGASGSIAKSPAFINDIDAALNF